MRHFHCIYIFFNELSLRFHYVFISFPLRSQGVAVLKISLALSMIEAFSSFEILMRYVFFPVLTV